MGSLWFHTSQLSSAIVAKLTSPSCILFFSSYVIISTVSSTGTVCMGYWFGSETMVLQRQEGAVSLGSGLDSWSVRRVQSVRRGELFEGKTALIFFPSLFFLLPEFPLSISLTFIMNPFCPSLRDLCKPDICLITDTTSAANGWH